MKVSNVNNKFYNYYKSLTAKKIAEKAEKNDELRKKLFELSIKRADEMKKIMQDPQHLIDLLA